MYNMFFSRESYIRMGTLLRPMIILLVVFTGMVAAEQCNEPSIDNGVVVGTQTLDAYFGRVSCLPGFQVFTHNMDSSVDTALWGS